MPMGDSGITDSTTKAGGEPIIFHISPIFQSDRRLCSRPGKSHRGIRLPQQAKLAHAIKIFQAESQLGALKLNINWPGCMLNARNLSPTAGRAIRWRPPPPCFPLVREVDSVAAVAADASLSAHYIP